MGPGEVRELTLAALPTAVAWARVFARAELRRWRLDDLADTVVLLVSELITNAVKATGPAVTPECYVELHDLELNTIRVRLCRTSAALIIQVWDADPVLPQLVRAGPDAESGRGLAVVSELSESWGSYPLGINGKVVWCRISTAASIGRPE
jgi:anti-sigma regulatory factor (Ser/Thr protein kinase)